MRRRTLKNRVVFTLSTSATKAGKELHAVVVAMTGNKWFPAYVAQIAAGLSAAQALDTAEHATVGGDDASFTTRDLKMVDAVKAAEELRGNVQTVVNANPSEATEIATSATMRLRQRGTVVKLPLKGKPSGLLGELALFARAIKGATSYEWMVSSDKTSWTSLTSTSRADTKIGGLVVGSVWYFKVRGITRKGPTSWSEVASATVA